MTEWVLLGVLAVLILFIVAMMLARYFRLRLVFARVAALLCDPETWNIRFFMRTFVVKGKVHGYPMRFSASGDVKGSVPAHAYLLLEHPVKGNFRFYKGGDISVIHPDIRPQFEAVQQIPDLYALIVTTEKTPWAAKILARPLGLGYKPGILMCTFGTTGFDAEALQHKFSLLIELAQHGV